jgi:Mo-dependent nitrogenase C-terminus
MKVFDNTTKSIFVTSWVSVGQTDAPASSLTPQHNHLSKPRFDIFRPLRSWIDNIPVCDRKLAHRVSKLIPAQCPFERDVKLFGKKLFHIPPMCKVNPLYEELVGLRFRALCYLADECGEDISQYC